GDGRGGGREEGESDREIAPYRQAVLVQEERGLYHGSPGSEASGGFGERLKVELEVAEDGTGSRLGCGEAGGRVDGVVGHLELLAGVHLGGHAGASLRLA